jgi:hypothetical protein
VIDTLYASLLFEQKKAKPLMALNARTAEVPFKSFPQNEATENPSFEPPTKLLHVTAVSATPGDETDPQGLDAVTLIVPFVFPKLMTTVLLVVVLIDEVMAAPDGSDHEKKVAELVASDML